MKEIYRESIKNLYSSQDIVIGLTGKTGSGCSTTANILMTEKLEELNIAKLRNYSFSDLEQRKFKFVEKYLKSDGNWKKFDVIIVTNIIVKFMFKYTYEDFIAYLDKIQSKDQNEYILINEYEKFKEKCKDIIKQGYEETGHRKPENYRELKEYYNEIIKLSGILKNIMLEHKVIIRRNNDTKTSNCYFYLLQVFGNNLRASGNPYCDNFSGKDFYTIAKEILEYIDFKKKDNKEEPIRICIDAIRNPYEAMYLKENCNNFYLVSVNTPEESRLTRLNKMMNKDEYEHLNYVEYPIKRQTINEIFYHQNIQKCLELSDIHFYNKECNDKKYYYLTSQIIRYVALMLHPGLISPTQIERCMQIAYDARVNSGCLSRKVGAVVTDQNYIIKSIGWNEVPEGQIPCNLRSLDDLIKSDEIAFSKYELENEQFKEKIDVLNKNLISMKKDCIIPYCYCFKDVYNGIHHSNNQVHTRALHAEENAFLNISKSGGTGIEGGYLFVTASPCELCSKKSYQLGIKKIYYIDPYPGISQKHILGYEKDANAPEMELYHGAIGYAYTRLYLPIISPKDELEIITGINPKKIESITNNSYEIIDEKIEWDMINNKYVREFSGKIVDNRDVIITTSIYFSNNSYNSVHPITADGFNTLLLTSETNKDLKHPYIQTFSLNKENLNNGEFKIGFEYDLNATNENKPFFMKQVLVDTKKLVIVVKFDKKINTIKGYICSDEYRNNKIIFVDCKELVTPDKCYQYEITFNNPGVGYYCCLDWSK